MAGTAPSFWRTHSATSNTVTFIAFLLAGHRSGPTSRDVPIPRSPPTLKRAPFLGEFPLRGNRKLSGRVQDDRRIFSLDEMRIRLEQFGDDNLEIFRKFFQSGSFGNETRYVLARCDPRVFAPLCRNLQGISHVDLLVFATRQIYHMLNRGNRRQEPVQSR